MTKTTLLLFLVVVLTAASVWAQTPVPVVATDGIGFTSASHAATNADGTPVINHYEVRFTPAAGCAPVPTVNAGKPALTANEVVIKPLAAFATFPANCVYTTVVAAVGPGGEGVSPPVPFVRVVLLVPAAPGAPAKR